MRASLALAVALVSACSSEAANTPDPVVTDTGTAVEDTAPPKCTPDRTADDRPDDVEGYQVRAYYVLPSDGKDEELDLNGRIERSVLSFNDWLGKQSGGAKLRLDTCDGKLDIGFVRLSKTDEQVKAKGAYVREAIEAELPKRGKKIFGAYYGGGSTYSCGGGAWPPELLGHVGAMYLHGTPPGPYPCDAHEVARPDIALGYFEMGMLHEIFHTLGAAAECAPHMIERGHVSEDPRDLLYRGAEFWKPEILDLNKDDYWAHGRSDCLDVSKSVFLDPLPMNAQLPPAVVMAMRALTALTMFVAASAIAPLASATGMQGHIWSSHCALETTTDGRLKTLLEKERARLDNGSFFPDSGYAAKHEYGETAHWERFVDGYIKWLRAKYTDPVREDPQHVAFLMGAASHGLVDQTFDILFMDRVREVDGPTDDLDTSMDIFLAEKRKFVPDFAYDADSLVDVFAKNVGLAVPASEIKKGMDLARVAQGLVAEILWKDAEKRGAQYPWARAHYQDPRVPGSYPWGSLAVVKYWQSIARRLDGDTSADALVVAENPPHALTAGKVDAAITLFTGVGLKRASITSATFYVTDAAGTVVATDLRVRGDEYATTLQLQPKSDWTDGARYTVVLEPGVETLDGTHPTERYELAFTVSPEAAGAAPPSPCPLALAAYPRPSDVNEEPTTPVAETSPREDSGGCVMGRANRSSAVLFGVALIWFARRRRRS